jgi:hypothetical protein
MRGEPGDQCILESASGQHARKNIEKRNFGKAGKRDRRLLRKRAERNQKHRPRSVIREKAGGSCPSFGLKQRRSERHQRVLSVIMSDGSHRGGAERASGGDPKRGAEPAPGIGQDSRDQQSFDGNQNDKLIRSGKEAHERGIPAAIGEALKFGKEMGPGHDAKRTEMAVSVKECVPPPVTGLTVSDR